MKPRALALLTLCVTFNVHAVESTSLYGDWCFYQQSTAGNTVKEKVDINLGSDSTYVWKEGPFEQKGTWSLSDNKLKMTKIGTHSIISLKDNTLTLERMSVQKYKKGKCSDSAFGPMDITSFHNAASTGEIDVLVNFLEKGIDINITDENRKESALIKSAKFCEVEAATLLINAGANKDIKNENGQKALDFAKSSQFHKGCDVLVKMLGES
ncbi:ankyrin repeat domain-containing protein [Atopomonas hussainii]|uniref:ankyrin repeat domain-containing protein n=1 Tax=Atopomonas hussainii TaxID=1429083 RepID=UPI0009004A21|nr:ankyrin repeat domain-containing protein [Atopomonas hussainii]